MLYWYNWFSWWWARDCSKHVENWNKHIEKNCASSWSFTKNQGKIVFLFIIILVSLDIKREHKIFWTEWWQAHPELNLLLISPWVNLPRDLIQDNVIEGKEDTHLHRHWNFKPLCVTTLYWTPSLSIFNVTQFEGLRFGEQQ